MHALAALTLVAIVVLIFGQTLKHGYTNWDAHKMVRDNSLLQGLTPAGVAEVLRPVPRQGEGLYAPVGYLTWMIDGALFGGTPGSRHLIDLLLHALNGILVYLLLRHLLGHAAYALLGALFFVSHPLQVESVAWIIGRRDLLAGAFSLLSVLAYLSYLSGKARRWFVVALMCYGLAVFSKPGAAALPAILLLLDFRHEQALDRGAWIGKVPFLLITLLAVVLNLQMADTSVVAFAPLSQRLLCVPWLAWHWLIHVLGFSGPVPFYPWPLAAAGPSPAVPGLLALCACLALLVVAWRRRWDAVWQALLAGAFAFAPAVLIVLEGKRPFVTGDRYGYLPIVALAALLPCALLPLTGRMRQAGVAILVLAIGACVLVSHRAAGTWKDSITLWSRVLEVYPGTHEALLNRGSAYADGGQFEKARSDYATALEARPEDRVLLHNLARLELQAMQSEEAHEYLKRYLAVGPPDLETYLALGYSAASAGWHRDALRWYGFAERTAPSDPRVHEGRSRAFLEEARRRLGVTAQGLDILAEAARRADSGGFPDATLHLLRRGIKVPSPHRGNFLYHMGRILLSRGSRAEGRSYLRAALEEDPTHAEARRLLGR